MAQFKLSDTVWRRVCSEEFDVTISIGWVRQRLRYQELVFVADSRVSDDRVFDSCPKILALPRNDCAIAFSGYTGDAFPMMLQLSLAIDSHNPAKSGELKLSSLKEHTIKVFNSMTETIRSSIFPRREANPTARFLLGGYSWFRKTFQLWHISYHAKKKTFVADPVPWVGFREQFGSVGFSYNQKHDEIQRIGQIGFIGDVPLIKLAKSMLSKRIKENAARNVYVLDMEPFMVVRDMLRTARTDDSIGGPPQIVVVHQFMQATPIGVYWPDKQSGGISIQGRRTLGYERIDRYVLDPDSLEVESPFSSERGIPPKNALAVERV